MNITDEKTAQSNISNCTENALDSIVKQWGSPVSTLLLHLPCSIFKIPEVDGIIGYKILRNCAVALGDPVCSAEDQSKLALAFHEYCQKSKLSIVYLLSSKSFSDWAIHNNFQTSIQAGEILTLDPSKFHITQKLRWKINQADQHGVIVQEYTQYDEALEKEMQTIHQQWLHKHNGRQVHLGEITFPIDHPSERLFYASHNGKVIGLLVLSPLDAFHGWVVISYCAINEAPVGTTELLLSTVINTLAQENCTYMCVGATAGKQMGETVGLGRISNFVARLIFKLSTKLFRFDSKQSYLHKFHPNSVPTCCVFSGKLNLNSLLAVKQLIDAKL